MWGREREREIIILIYIEKCIRTIYVEKCIRIYKNIKVKNIKYEYKNEVVICLLSMFYNTKKHSKLYHKLYKIKC